MTIDEAVAIVRRCVDWVEYVKAEVDRRIANHPDLAELDDYLDERYP